MNKGDVMQGQPTIIDAAKSLLRVCDGAEERDNVGYNGTDAPFVRSLFSRQWLSPKQLVVLHKLLAKYAKQLATHGFEYATLVVPQAGPRTSATGSEGTSAPVKVEEEYAPVARTKLEKFVAKNPTAQVPATLSDPMRNPSIASKPVNFPPDTKHPAWAPQRDIMSYFPPQFTPRPQQTEAIQKIDASFRAGKRIAVLEMATGGGKSIICKTFANAVRDNGAKTHFLTIQKALQSQYQRDFPAPEIETVKGRSNYGCPLRAGSDCAHAPCGDQKKGILPECIVGGDSPEVRRAAVQMQLDPADHLCPYWKQLQIAHNSAITLFNFSSFLFQQRIGRFGHRDLMIIDEGHNIESQLVNYVSMELTEWTLSIVNVEIDRQITTKQQFVEWLRETEILVKIGERLGDDDEASEDSENSDLDKAEADALRDLQGKLENFMVFLDKTEWILETVSYEDKRSREQRRKIVARPLYVKEFAQELLFGKAARVLVMSATILDVKIWAKNLGIPLDQVEHINFPSDFPVENRTIHLTYAGNMGHRYFSAQQNPKDPTQPKFVRAVDNILRRHTGQRGIIHCHSFKLAKVIQEEIPNSRYLFQWDFPDKEAMLVAHSQRADSVIVAPAMHEGFDLKDDLSRFQIIAKVPWPDMTDKVIAERLARKDGYFEWITALKLVQSYGRSVRSKTDFAYTYILDSGFEGFRNRNASLIPGWVSAAIRKYGPSEIRHD